MAGQEVLQPAGRDLGQILLQPKGLQQVGLPLAVQIAQKLEQVGAPVGQEIGQTVAGGGALADPVVVEFDQGPQFERGRALGLEGTQGLVMPVGRRGAEAVDPQGVGQDVGVGDVVFAPGRTVGLTPRLGTLGVDAVDDIVAVEDPGQQSAVVQFQEQVNLPRIGLESRQIAGQLLQPLGVMRVTLTQARLPLEVQGVDLVLVAGPVQTDDEHGLISWWGSVKWRVTGPIMSVRLPYGGPTDKPGGRLCIGRELMKGRRGVVRIGSGQHKAGGAGGRDPRVARAWSSPGGGSPAPPGDTSSPTTSSQLPPSS